MMKHKQNQGLRIRRWRGTEKNQINGNQIRGETRNEQVETNLPSGKYERKEAAAAMR
jgi:hypothetical protein